jgi:hypothetical protein
MKQKILGCYKIGWEQVQIVCREGFGGEFYLIPENGSVPRIKIGMDYSEWGHVLSVLLHEVQEFVLTRISCRYENSNDYGNENSGYIFFFDHTKFTDMCARTAEFLVNCTPDLADVWNEWKKNKKLK